MTLETPLYQLHQSLQGKIVDFAGYYLPLQFQGAIIEQHHTRNQASLFDVSHMGQVIIKSADISISDIAIALEKIMPTDLLHLKTGHSRYTFLTNETGGILDDLIINKTTAGFFIVFNAACKVNDIQHIKNYLPENIDILPLDNHALIALQGPKAVEILSQIIPEVKSLKFMSAIDCEILGNPCRISRSGYTGEDGFEISLPSTIASQFAQTLLDFASVAPAGLAARDILRLEAGLCLYGHDLTTQITPIEANLLWAISKRRRQEGGFIGSEVILKQIQQGTDKTRVGLLPEGKAPLREGTELLDAQEHPIGYITSGSFSPSLNRPIAMGYIDIAYSQAKTQIFAKLRNKTINCQITPLPFITTHYSS